MPAKQTHHIALIETRAAWIGGQVTQGGHASTSELIRTLRIRHGGKLSPGRAVSMRMPHGKGQA
ncbi:hypothetical protein [Methylobacterium sp. PvR107]|uniref:hypothetical protein n=1 Tax=Methylobacterium sp. PvR107 TaxID=2806597 RepID=UPI001AE87C90|nr:hypothetical protein [Methylobacterium sp. PvR107]MBP1181570.1 hypothetical protein [Methylobacterium sp. PvR107]